MEGVAFQIVWMMEQFPVRPSADGIKLSGGASKSDVWCQLVADIAQVPVRIPEVADLACVGAAILAGVGCGIYRDASDGYRHLAVGERVLQSDPNRAALYQELFEKYKQNAAILSNMDT
jgi:autoinducer 2 (AI-2) kinase